MVQTKIKSFGGNIAITGTLTVNNVENSFIPTGLIIIWNSLTAPTGWAICDGTNGTPNLTDKFVIASGQTYSPGQTGGAYNVTLSNANLPSHNHAVQIGAVNQQHGHNFTGFSNLNFGWQLYGGQLGFFTPGANQNRGVTASGMNHNHTVNLGNTGSSSAWSPLPPFYTLSYIMKL